MISFIKDFLRDFYTRYTLPITVHNNTDSKDRVLICYIKSPFYNKSKIIKHCNIIESRIIAETFFKSGYSVDVVDYRCMRKIDYSKYSVIFGFGHPFRRAFIHKANSIKILYLTGCLAYFSNFIEAKRVREFNKRHDSFLTPEIEAYWPSVFPIAASNAVMHTGNSWTKSTYSAFKQNFFTIPVMSIIDEDYKPLTFHKNARDFIWIGGHGAIAKGLDLVIDAFKLLKTDSKLHIFGSLTNEPNFYNVYKDLFDNDKSILFHGMADVNSDGFKEIVQHCAFTVFPGSAEAGASSVLTTMHLGLLPIVTLGSSIDLVDFGVFVDKLDVKSTQIAMEKALDFDEDKILEQRKAVINHIKKNHSAKSFKNTFEAAFDKIINI